MAESKLTHAKVLVVGEQGVGKSSLVGRYVTDSFDDHVTSTVGASYFEKCQEIGDYQVKLKIWDTAGQERYKSLIPMYYRNTNVALLVYDVTNRVSFKALEQWKAEFHNNTAEQNTLLFVVGNKSDSSMKEQRIPTEEGRNFAKNNGAFFHEVSALSSNGVHELFNDICLKIIHAQQSADQRSANQRGSTGEAIFLPQKSHKSSVCCS